MTALALLALAQEFPPPPEPSGSLEIDTMRVVGVVIVSLGAIVILALAVRPLIVKPVRARQERAQDAETATEPEPEPERPAPSNAGAIIPFPHKLAPEGAGGSSWTAGSPAITERFNRVIGEPGARRKLGDLNPPTVPRDPAADRLPADASPRVDEASPALARLVGIHGADVEATPGPSRTWTPRRPPIVLPTPERRRSPVSFPEPERPAGPEYPHDEEHAAETRVVETRDAATADQSQPAVEEPVVVSTAAGEPEAGAEPDTATLAALHQVVRDLIYCANAGEVLQGFALYSDPFLFRFLDETGMSEIEFRDTFAAIKARPRDAWEHLDRMTDIIRLAGGAIEATVSYVGADGRPKDGLERYRFVEVDGVWMIDDIRPLENGAG